MLTNSTTRIFGKYLTQTFSSYQAKNAQLPSLFLLNQNNFSNYFGRDNRYNNDSFDRSRMQKFRRNDNNNSRNKKGFLNNPKFQKLINEKIEWSKENLTRFRKDFYKEHENIKNLSNEEVEEYRKSLNMNVVGKNIPKPFKNFHESNLPSFILSRLKSLGLDSPTPIQSQGIPMALSGRDFIGISRTGSGKTLAYLMPAIVHIREQDEVEQGQGPIGLILAPTRELTLQINNEIKKFAKENLIRHCAVYGGADRQKQINNLSKSPDVLVATPGRLIDLLNEGHTNFKRTTYLVLDEADRMLDMGFRKELEIILSCVRPDKQLLMWSATWPKEIQDIANRYMHPDYLKVNIGSTDLHANENIDQYFKACRTDADKFKLLANDIKQLCVDNGKKILVFTNTKRKADHLERFIVNNCQYRKVAAIHGNKTQSRRDAIMSDFRNNAVNVLIATDVASRGIDIKDIDCVLIYDFPLDIESYIHRIGRTGRGYNKGASISYLTDDDLNSDSRLIADLVRVLRASQQKVPSFLC